LAVEPVFALELGSASIALPPLLLPLGFGLAPTRGVGAAEPVAGAVGESRPDT